MRKILMVALASALAAPAAACPSGREDALRGVTVAYDDGSVSHYSLDSDGVVTEEALFDDPIIDGYRVHALHGLYVLDEYDLIDGAPDEAGRMRQSYAEGPKALPQPAPGVAWQGEVTVTTGDLTPFARMVAVAVGQPVSVDYGGCVYDSWPAEVHHRDDEEDYTMTFDYLPALGIAVFRSYADRGAEAELYAPVSITQRQP